MARYPRSIMIYSIRTKACKRCGGDLSLERDEYGVYIECIQCGANWSKKDLTLPRKKIKTERKLDWPSK
jgi:hypothetical protein